MALETANFIHQLNPSYPSRPEDIVEGADHLRTIKRSIKNTFPGIQGPLRPEITHDFLNDLLNQLIPLGSIVPYALPVAPPGWAICDGSLANRSDGSGTIQTPDLRGRTLVGATEARPLGTLFGNAQSTLTTTAAGRHGHPGTAQIPETSVNVSVAVGPATQETTINQTKGSNWDAGGGTGAPVTNVTVTNVAHNHPVTVTPAPIPARSVDLSIGEAGDHAHQITVDLHQPSASIVYIMKV